MVDKVLIRFAIFAIIATIVFAVFQPLIWASLDKTPSASLVSDLGSLMSLMIMIIALGVAAVGGLAYFSLKGRLATDIDEKAEAIQQLLRQQAQQERASLSINVFTELSGIHWAGYRDLLTRELQNHDSLWFHFADPALDSAIAMAEAAAGAAEELHEQEFGEAVIEARNIHAYHLASRGHESDFEGALAKARYVLERASGYAEGAYHWKETYAWVMARLGREERHKTEARLLVRELLDDESIPGDWQKRLEAKYDNLLTHS